MNSMNISVGLSAAISSYSRIEINKYKYIKNNVCLYSDTDSVILEKPLPNEYINKNIGMMKLEYSNIIEGIFLSPKVYALKLESGEIITKIKGLNVPININDLKKLLYFDSKLIYNKTI